MVLTSIAGLLPQRTQTSGKTCCVGQCFLLRVDILELDEPPLYLAFSWLCWPCGNGSLS